EVGKQQAKAVAAGLSRQQVLPSVLVSSPLLRARQTAEGMLQAWGEAKPELRVCEDLAPGGKRRRLTRYLRDLAKDKVALVGHQPDLGIFGAWLIGSKKAQLDLAKAGVACIASDERPDKGTCRVVWMLTPTWLGV